MTESQFSQRVADLKEARGRLKEARDRAQDRYRVTVEQYGPSGEVFRSISQSVGRERLEEIDDEEDRRSIIRAIAGAAYRAIVELERERVDVKVEAND